MWKIWGGFGVAELGSEKVSRLVGLYLLSREVLNDSLFWLSEPRWGEREDKRALLKISYRRLSDVDKFKVWMILKNSRLGFRSRFRD